MSNEIENEMMESKEDILHWQRQPIPDTKNLQAAIIEKSYAVTQRVENEAVQATHRHLFHGSMQRWLVGAICLVVVAMSSMLLLPEGAMQNPSITTEYSAEELELQEIMLLEDELLFASI